MKIALPLLREIAYVCFEVAVRFFEAVLLDIRVSDDVLNSGVNRWKNEHNSKPLVLPIHWDALVLNFPVFIPDINWVEGRIKLVLFPVIYFEMVADEEVQELLVCPAPLLEVVVVWNFSL